jgi:hypothetical protein
VWKRNANRQQKNVLLYALSVAFAQRQEGQEYQGAHIQEREYKV